MDIEDRVLRENWWLFFRGKQKQQQQRYSVKTGHPARENIWSEIKNCDYYNNILQLLAMYYNIYIYISPRKEKKTT